MTDTITLPRAVIQDTLEFTEFLWRDVHLNDYASAKLDEVMGKLSAALAQKAEQDEVGINGLTDAETRATMSVRGLSKPKKKKKKKLTSYERKCFNDWKNP